MMVSMPTLPQPYPCVRMRTVSIRAVTSLCQHCDRRIDRPGDPDAGRVPGFQPGRITRLSGIGGTARRPARIAVGRSPNRPSVAWAWQNAPGWCATATPSGAMTADLTERRTRMASYLRDGEV